MHSDPLYLAIARVVRAQVRHDWRFDNEVRCWRGGDVLESGQPFDVGHINPTRTGHAKRRDRQPRPTRQPRTTSARPPPRTGLAPATMKR